MGNIHFQEAEPVVKAPAAIAFADISISGELETRVRMNYERLHDPEHWSVEKVFREAEYEWPGDQEGRTILGVSLLAQCLHADSENLENIMARLKPRLSGQGYFGTVYPEGVFDEQQLSSHGWYGRGLSEYYMWKKDEETRQRILELLNGYVLKTWRQWGTYPKEERTADKEGQYIGERGDKRVGNWILSTDTSCAFIFGGAVMDLYILTSDPKLLDIARDMAELFMEIDHEARSSQLHASLTALRWMIKLYEYTGERKYLEYIEKMHRLVIDKAVTANFETYNWFNIPKWTEGCGVVDLFQLSLNLWRLTGKSEYADFAELVYYNGLNRLQRSNGGLGLDTCPRDGVYELKASGYEAWWCCSMRSAEGYANAVMHSYAVEGDTVWVPLFFNNKAAVRLSSGDLQLSQKTRYPAEGCIRISIEETSCTAEAAICLRLPEWAKGYRLAVNGHEVEASQADGFITIRRLWKKGDVLEYHMEYSTRIGHAYREIDLPAVPGEVKGFSLFYGPLQLAADSSRTDYPVGSRLLLVKEGKGNHIQLNQDTAAEHESRFDIPEAHFYAKLWEEDREILLVPLCESTRYVKEMFKDNVQSVLFDGMTK